MITNSKLTFGERMTNPVIGRVIKQQLSGEQANTVSRKSVYIKSALFLFIFLIGVALAFAIHAFTTPIEIEGVDMISVSSVEAVLAIVSVILAIVCSIVASLSVRLAGIFGSICCVAYGYTLGLMAVAIPSYQGPILLALALTVAVVAGLILLYRTNIIRVTQKFRAVVAILFWAMIVGTLLMLIMSFIPVTRDAVSWVYGNPILSITLGVFGVVIASMFLLCDFDAIEKAVEMGADKKFENMLAFGLAFSVIWLYFKILQLILRIMEHTRN